MNKKIVILAVALVLLLGVTAGVTFAYLTSQTEQVVNTFCYGNVQIDLWETDVDLYGVKDSDNLVKANKYKFIPGESYLKDPTVYLDAKSEESYIFVVIDNEINDYLIDAAYTDVNGVEHKTLEAQMTANGWSKLTDDSSNDVLLGGNAVWTYSSTVTGSDLDDDDATTGDKTYTIFNEVTVKAGADVTQIESEQLVITAYAAQADVFASAYAAWVATFGA